MCNAGGELKTHSNVVAELYSSLVQETNFSSLTNASYITNINHTTPTIEIVDPTELTKFHVAIVSGKSE